MPSGKEEWNQETSSLQGPHERRGFRLDEQPANEESEEKIVR